MFATIATVATTATSTMSMLSLKYDQNTPNQTIATIATCTVVCLLCYLYQMGLKRWYDFFQDKRTGHNSRIVKANQNRCSTKRFRKLQCRPSQIKS